LRIGEAVHHLNGDRTDNRLENLQVMTRSEHAILHQEAKKAARADAYDFFQVGNVVGLSAYEWGPLVQAGLIVKLPWRPGQMAWYSRQSVDAFALVIDDYKAKRERAKWMERPIITARRFATAEAAT